MTETSVVPSTCVVLSAHLDDAVFSAWHVLSRGGTDVVVATVFAGIPERGFVAALDRTHGATESAAWVERRRSEDRDVLAAAGCRIVHLPLLDVLYRSMTVSALWPRVEAEPHRLLELASTEPQIHVVPETIHRALAPHIDDQTAIYAPVGIGGHPDHVAVGRAALGLTASVREVRFYADSPYYLADGMPSVITGDRNDAADARLRDGLAELSAPRLNLHHVELTDAEIENKARAMRSYRTEFSAIDNDFGGATSDPSKMRHELWWSLP